jgi:hypothetical protein
MSGVDELEKVLHLAVTDGAFRKLLVTNPEAALKSQGIEAKPARVEALKSLSYPQLQALAKAFDHPDVNLIQ